MELGELRNQLGASLEARLQKEGVGELEEFFRRAFPLVKSPEPFRRALSRQLAWVLSREGRRPLRGEVLGLAQRPWRLALGAVALTLGLVLILWRGREGLAQRTPRLGAARLRLASKSLLLL